MPLFFSNADYGIQHFSRPALEAAFTAAGDIFAVSGRRAIGHYRFEMSFYASR